LVRRRILRAWFFSAKLVRVARPLNVNVDSLITVSRLGLLRMGLSLSSRAVAVLNSASLTQGPTLSDIWKNSRR
jgi:hypothetical protein